MLIRFKWALSLGDTANKMSENLKCILGASFHTKIFSCMGFSSTVSIIGEGGMTDFKLENTMRQRHIYWFRKSLRELSPVESEKDCRGAEPHQLGWLKVTSLLIKMISKQVNKQLSPYQRVFLWNRASDV